MFLVRADKGHTAPHLCNIVQTVLLCFFCLFTSYFLMLSKEIIIETMNAYGLGPSHFNCHQASKAKTSLSWAKNIFTVYLQT